MTHPSEYILEKYKGRNTRFKCPKCLKQGELTCYIHPINGDRLPDYVGICNRRDRCGYQYTNWDYIKENSKDAWERSVNFKVEAIKIEPSYVDWSNVVQTQSHYEKNHFYQYLSKLFGERHANLVFQQYYIGTSKHWDGAIIFWQVDCNKRVRGGKVMLYNPVTGKRDGKHQTWVHSILKLQDFNLFQCLFGEHLLSLKEKSSKPIALVESEKTALIASAMVQDVVWLATGGLTMLNPETRPDRFACLKGRNVILYPDLGTGKNQSGETPFDLWSKKLEVLKRQGINATVSSLLEDECSLDDRKEGLDIADFFIKEKEMVS